MFTGNFPMKRGKIEIYGLKKDNLIWQPLFTFFYCFPESGFEILTCRELMKLDTFARVSEFLILSLRLAIKNTAKCKLSQLIYLRGLKNEIKETPA